MFYFCQPLSAWAPQNLR